MEWQRLWGVRDSAKEQELREQAYYPALWVKDSDKRISEVPFALNNLSYSPKNSQA